MTGYEKAYTTASEILKKLTPAEMEWIRQTSYMGSIEERAFRDAYHAWLDEDTDTPEPIFVLTEEDTQTVARDVVDVVMSSTLFILTEEDAQIVARDLIDRELTPEEMRVVKKGVENGLDDWSIVMTTAVRYAAGESE